MLSEIAKNIDGIEESLNLNEFFDLGGGEVIHQQETSASYVSRCLKVVVEDTRTALNYSFHIKWIPSKSKAMKSRYEPIVSNVLRQRGIDTPKVLAYIPEGILTDGMGEDPCVVSEYYDSNGEAPIELNQIATELNDDEKIEITNQLAIMVSKMHGIDQEYGRKFGLDRCTGPCEAQNLIAQAHGEGFLTDSQFYRVKTTFERVANHPLVLVHKDIHGGNLIVEKGGATISIACIVDLEHAEFTGIGQEFFALTAFYFPKMGGNKIEHEFLQQYITSTGRSFDEIKDQIATYGIARAANLFLAGQILDCTPFIDSARQFKDKYLSP